MKCHNMEERDALCQPKIFRLEIGLGPANGDKLSACNRQNFGEQDMVMN